VAKIIGIREQLGGWDTPLGRAGLFGLLCVGIGAALVAWPMKPNGRRRRRRLRRNDRPKRIGRVAGVAGPSPYEDYGTYKYFVFLTYGPQIGAGYGIDSGWDTKVAAERAAERVRRTRPLSMGVHVFARRHLKTIGFNPMYLRSWKRAPERSGLVANPQLRVVVKSPLGHRLAMYGVEAASLREAFDRAEDEAERLGVRVSGSRREGNTYTIVGTTRAFARH